MIAACLLSFSIGFLSLSQEILWVRLFGFTNHSLPQAFAFVLTCYLIGIAIGASMGKKFCEKANDLWFLSGVVLLIASFFDFTSPWIYAQFSQTTFQVSVGGLLILLTALLKAIIFPIVHHLGTPNSSNIGRAISKVYVSNIIGATLGPIITSMLLLDIFTTQQCFAICAAVTCIAGLFCLPKKTLSLKFIAAIFLMMISMGFMLERQPSLLIAKLSAGNNIRKMIETKQGIITIYDGGEKGDIVLGSNVYDGRTNLNPIINSNGLNRILVLSAIQTKPTHVLVIGLSIGTWLTLITRFPGVEHIDVVEINPGYLQAIQDYPPQYNALHDTRVHLYIDDGRRWLKTHATNQYDLIVMNTTFYWRAYASNLLSQDFLMLLKKHMTPQGVLAYNSTGSLHAFKTATTIFPYAYLYGNVIIAADFDWRDKLKISTAAKILSSLTLDGKPLFSSGNEKIINKFLNQPLVSIETISKKFEEDKIEVVTDRNLLTEYKYGKML